MIAVGGGGEVVVVVMVVWGQGVLPLKGYDLLRMIRLLNSILFL